MNKISAICISGLLFTSVASQLVSAQTTSKQNTQVKAEATSCPLFEKELDRATRIVEAMIVEGVVVPVPKDPGGGYTHEQHKRNYQGMLLGGRLFTITADDRYLDFVKAMLLEYAKTYPTLGPHPARGSQEPGRLFWQNLNDSVWLVHTIQAYTAIRENLADEDRKTIESKVLIPAAMFLSVGSPRTFARIHNHATWAAAAVGMTGYALGESRLVEMALLGPALDGKAGFLRQLNELFSPDGYYSEGPYYQRYALLPFVLFADAINANSPKLGIFEQRNGILLKALRTAIDLSYNGYFFPINDAIKDKSLRTEELYEAIAIAYAKTLDPQLLSIVQMQNRTVLTEKGRKVACDVQADLSKDYAFKAQILRDGALGDQGALAILRAGTAANDATVVIKNTSQGMGHGHFDKLNWLYFDNQYEVVTDYGAARFLNVEAKQGGVYLPENTTWAKQTIAHNSLVRDERSHFDGDLKLAELHAPQQLHFSAEPSLQISSAQIDQAYPDTQITRTIAMLAVPGLERPLIVDLLKVESKREHQYDLPLHYRGHLTRIGATLKSYVAERPVLGKANGYQHIWLDARAKPNADQAFATWILGNRFYTWRWAPQKDAELLLAQTGANDPQFNLRREPILIQRLPKTRNAVFASILESHGNYDGATEQTVASDSQVRQLSVHSDKYMHLLQIETAKPGGVVLAVSYDPDSSKQHQATVAGQVYKWRGFAARFDLAAGSNTESER